MKPFGLRFGLLVTVGASLIGAILQAGPSQGTPGRRSSRKSEPTPPLILEGVVTGTDGAPIEGARVVSRAGSSDCGDVPPPVRTDAGGHFRIELKTPGPVDVRVESNGLAPWAVEKARPGTTLRVSLDRGLAIIGSVRDPAGRSVPLARILATPASGAPVSVWDTRS